MKPLTVSHERQLRVQKWEIEVDPTRWYVQMVDLNVIAGLRRAIDAGRVDHVVLVGSNCVHGWRLGVHRPVVFLERPSVDVSDAITQRQASMRIVQMEGAR